MRSEGGASQDPSPGARVPFRRSVSASGGVTYPVIVERGLLSRTGEMVRSFSPAHRYAVISDDTVAGLHGEAVIRSFSRTGADAALFTFPAGEARKTRESWSALTDSLLAAGHGRDSAIVALGGGVTGDLAGFVAATYMRGLDVVQVPTTYVAMMDASVGGKTGVDVPAGKNLVGAFHPPKAVLVDPEVAATLPVQERVDGLAEPVKHGAILDADYLELLGGLAEALVAGEAGAVERAVTRSVELKAEVVEQDEFEGGYRQILNFGHTVGHGIEAASDYGVSHGSAVALGMLVEARLGEELGVTERGTAAELARALELFGLPTRLRRALDPEQILVAMQTDKKARAGAIRYVLLERIGSVARQGGWAREISDDRLVTSTLQTILGS